jgi:hypothetical protein
MIINKRLHTKLKKLKQKIVTKKDPNMFRIHLPKLSTQLEGPLTRKIEPSSTKHGMLYVVVVRVASE